MERIYAELLRLTLHHAYFRDSGAAFGFLPQAETRAVIARSGLLFRETGSGFSLLYPAIRNELDALVPVRPLPVPGALRFWITATAPYTGAVSDLPLFRTHHALPSFDNLTDRSAGDTLYLTAGAPAETHAGASDMCDLAPEFWRYDAAAAAPALIQVRDAFGAVVHTLLQNPVEGRIQAAIRLADHAAGRAVVSVDGASGKTVYVPESTPPPNAFGAVDLYADTRVPAPYRFSDGAGLPQPKTFTLRFDARKSTWRYIVVPRFNTSLTAGQLSVDHADNLYPFLAAVETQTVAGAPAFLLASDGTMPHSETPITGLMLKRGGTALIPELPNPGPEQIRAENGDFVADMMVVV